MRRDKIRRWIRRVVWWLDDHWYLVFIPLIYITHSIAWYCTGRDIGACRERNKICDSLDKALDNDEMSIRWQDEDLDADEFLRRIENEYN